MPRMSGKKALLEQLVADDFRYIFGNPGTTEQAFMDMLQEYPRLEFILCLHETVAVGIADGYARATRKPAFVELHIAPGLGNAAGMLFNALASHTSMVVYVGQSASTALFQEPLLSHDLVSIAKPVTKWAYEVGHASDVPQALRRALKVSDEIPQGPVVLSVPLDVLDQEGDLEIVPTSYTRWRSYPDPSAMDEAADLLKKSERPLILLGDGVALSDGQQQLAGLAELLGAPVYAGYASEVNIANDHPLNCGALPNTSARAPEVTSKLLGQHDVVLAVGTPLFRFVFPNQTSLVPPGTKVIQIDLDSWEIGKNIPGVLGIQADCRAALEGLLDRLESAPTDAARARVAAIAEEQRKKREAALEGDKKVWDATPISVPRMMGEIANVLPKDAVVFDEAMTSRTVLARYVTPKPGQYFRARGGGIGPGVPGAIGVKLAMPDRPVVAVVADGASLFTTTAFWTAAHHKIPVVWVVCNNASYRILKENVMDYLGPDHANRQFVALDLTDPPLHFNKIAESMGVAGRRVEKPEELRKTLEWALGLGAPAVVDVAIDGRVR